MNVLLAVSLVLWLLTVMLRKLSIETIGTLVSTGLFCSRKFGHFCKLRTVLVIECISCFLDWVCQMVFKNISWITFLMTVAVRLVFIAICYHDMTAYTYVKEIHRKGEGAGK